MSDIDLYSELSLDRSLDSDEIDRRLAQQLAETPESDNARRDMLATSRAILGNSQRRTVYDNGLADPNSPDWTVRRLHSLASNQDVDSNGPVISVFAPAQADTGNSSAESTDEGNFATYSASPYEVSNASTGSVNRGSDSFVNVSNNFVGNKSPAGFQSSGFGSPQSHNGNDGFGQSTSSSSAKKWKAKLPVNPERKRRESLMWTIGLGLILVGWLISTVKFYIDLDSASSGDDSDLSDLIQHMDIGDGVLLGMATSVSDILNIILSLVFLQFLWNVRILLWRRGHKDSAR